MFPIKLHVELGCGENRFIPVLWRPRFQQTSLCRLVDSRQRACELNYAGSRERERERAMPGLE